MGLSIFRRIPDAVRAALEAEGIVHLEELVTAVVSTRYIRMPSLYARGRLSRGKGSIAITRKRLYVHTTWTGQVLVGQLINIAWDQPEMDALTFSIDEKKRRLVIEIAEISRIRNDAEGGFKVALGCADPPATLPLIEDLRRPRS
ncbi:MAG: hypothetical protein ACR2OC_00960 [Solirubrobacterales bacterium]